MPDTSPLYSREEALNRADRFYRFWQQNPENAGLFRDTFSAQLSVSAFAQISQMLANPPSGFGADELEHLHGLYELASNQLDKARLRFERLLTRQPDLLPVRLNLAKAIALQQQYSEALTLLAPYTPDQLGREGMLLRLRLLYLQGELEQVIAGATDWLTLIDANDGTTAGLLSMALADRGELNQAGHWATHALQCAPNADAHTTLGTLAFAQQDIKAAREQFARARQLDLRSGRAWFGMAMCHVACQEEREADVALEQAATLFPGYIGTWHLLGWRAALAGDLDAAQRHFEQALALNRNFADTHGGLAVVALKRGDLAEGARCTELALKLDPASFGGRYARALLLEARGDVQAAQQALGCLLDQPMPDGQTLARSIQAMVQPR